MIARRELLLLADDALGREFQARLGPQRVVHHTDAYEALAAMSRDGWPAVVLTAPRPDFQGLCRACRRLQGGTRLLALCGPAGEPQLRAMIGRELDDYFIYPPTRDDWRAIREALGEPQAAEAAPAPAPGRAHVPEPSAEAPGAAAPAEAPAEPVAVEIVEAIAAARSVAALEAHLSERLSRLAEAPLVWMDASSAPPGATPLLRHAGPPGRVLLPKSAPAAPPAALGPVLRDLQHCLPALADSARRTQSLLQLAITDHLTGAYNRRYFYFVTDQVLQRWRQRSPHATLLLFDIDNFKRYNDTYGHAAGDEILRQTAGILKRITRAQDIIARIGGDEFAVLFWDEEPRVPNSQPPESPLILADRFRKIVQTHQFPSLGPEAKGVLTISGGLATFPQDGRTCRELLRKADRALKRVKLSGKNGIHLVGSPPPEEGSA